MQPRAVALRLALVLALTAALAAGCGSEAPEPQADLTTEQVMEHFAGRAGVPLVVTSAYEDASWDILGFPEDVPPGLKRRYGTFSVYVVKERGRALSSLLADKATGEPLQARRGIFWELDTLSGTWVAHTRYGPNVVLVWFSEKRKPEVDARWRRLHDALAGMAS